MCLWWCFECWQEAVHPWGLWIAEGGERLVHALLATERYTAGQNPEESQPYLRAGADYAAVTGTYHKKWVALNLKG